MFRTIALLLAATGLAAAQTNPAAVAAHKCRQDYERAILSEFSELLAIPNIASDKPDFHRNAEFIRTILEKRGVAAPVLEFPDANPVGDGALRTGAARPLCREGWPRHSARRLPNQAAPPSHCRNRIPRNLL